MNRHVLKALRVVRGLTQEKIREQIDIKSYHLKESGRMNFSEEDITKLSRFFDVPVDDLFFGDGVHITRTAIK